MSYSGLMKEKETTDCKQERWYPCWKDNLSILIWFSAGLTGSHYVWQQNWVGQAG